MQGIIQCARHILVIRQTICGTEDGRQQNPSTIPEPECLFPVSTAYLFSCHVIQCNLDYLTNSEELSSQQQAAFQIQVVQVQSNLQSAYRPRAPSRGIYVQYLCLDGIVWQFVHFSQIAITPSDRHVAQCFHQFSAATKSCQNSK